MIFFTFGVDLHGSSAVAVGVGEHGVLGAQSEFAVDGLQSAGLPAIGEIDNGQVNTQWNKRTLHRSETKTYERILS